LRRSDGLRGRVRVARHAFLSFVVEDLDLVNLFRGQARNQRSDLSFDDYSVREPFNSVNADYIRAQIRPRIRAASLLVCLVGTGTAGSRWVDWEIRYAGEQGKRLLGVRLHSGRRNERTPRALTDLRATVLDWNIPTIVRWVG
jgi:hypothetical protein